MANVEALKQLRRVVEEAPEERFDMSVFESKYPGCGTVRCAAGWAAVDPWHQANTVINEILPLYQFAGETHVSAAPVDPRRLAEIYGIDEHDSGRLFFPGSCPSRAQVIASIDNLIAGEEAIDYDDDYDLDIDDEDDGDDDEDD